MTPEIWAKIVAILILWVIYCVFWWLNLGELGRGILFGSLQWFFTILSFVFVLWLVSLWGPVVFLGAIILVFVAIALLMIFFDRLF